jgi:pSer/pThr/pTyr-binding forkhead associated (FHA) protein
MQIYRVIFTSGGKPQYEHMVSTSPQFIGRSSRADIVLSEDNVSRRHARLFVPDDTLFVEDLGSSNGVLVNNERVVKKQLLASDTVQIGS